MYLTVSERQFRTNMCEFICTYYIARKRQISWRGPLGEKPRPRGWTSSHERAWEDYLRWEHFSNEFWDSFWSRVVEGLWESRVSGWRDCFEYVVLHYIQVQPNKISEDGLESLHSEEEYSEED